MIPQVQPAQGDNRPMRLSVPQTASGITGKPRQKAVADPAWGPSSTNQGLFLSPYSQPAPDRKQQNSASAENHRRRQRLSGRIELVHGRLVP